MTIDLHAVNHQLPMLTIVNETLHTHIQLHLKQHSSKYGEKSVEDILAERRFPFTLPFYLPHEQCVLGLTGNRPVLGEINYKISTALPISQQPSAAYERVQKQPRSTKNAVCAQPTAIQDNHRNRSAGQYKRRLHPATLQLNT